MKTNRFVASGSSDHRMPLLYYATHRLLSLAVRRDTEESYTEER
jgi:hypothetical protein